jgi:hypothetical protein
MLDMRYEHVVAAIERKPRKIDSDCVLPFARSR